MERDVSREPLRVLVAEDEPIARERLVEAVDRTPGFAVTDACGDGEAAARLLSEARHDLALLDVQMPGLDGFEVIGAVGPERMPPVVFVTAHDRFALRAFEIAAIDFLAKPWDRERLAKALERAREECARRSESRLAERLSALLAAHRTGSPERIAVRSQGRVLLLDPGEIERVEGAGNYLRVFCGHQEHLVRDTLDAFAARLGAPDFLRILRSHLVRLTAVRELLPDGAGGHLLRLRNGDALPVGPRHLAGVLAALGV